jgi:hypothetical protein
MAGSVFTLKDGSVEMGEEGLNIRDNASGRRRRNIAGILLFLCFLLIYAWARLMPGRSVGLRTMVSWALFIFLCFRAYEHITRRWIFYSTIEHIPYPEIKGIAEHFGFAELKPSLELRLRDGQYRYLRVRREDIAMFKNHLQENIQSCPSG